MHRFAILVLALAALCCPAAAATLTGVHSFCRGACLDGQKPTSQLLAGPDGTYYGTTNEGGRGGNGTVFGLKFSGTKWVLNVIYNFCRRTNCDDGSLPQGGVIMDTSGNLYGMASQYGVYNAGLIYELSPVGSRWKFKILYNFCVELNCPNGGPPPFGALSYKGQASGARYDGTSPLYGTTQYGSSSSGGVVFQLTPTGKHWRYDVIHVFCSLANCSDGGVPYTGVTVDANGNLFGVDSIGGVQSDSNTCCGVLYEMSPNGMDWTFQVLHEFCSKMSGGICTDGRQPLPVPTIDAAGNIFGTTYEGGGSLDAGTIYEYVPATHKLFTVHAFCTDMNCTDGKFPYIGSLVLGASGELYGTTVEGAGAGGGDVFKLVGKHLTVLGSFDGLNGAYPESGPTLEPSGSLLGMTMFGGLYMKGAVYELTP